MKREAVIAWGLTIVLAFAVHSEPNAEPIEYVPEPSPVVVLRPAEYIFVDEEAANKEASSFWDVPLDHELQEHIIQTCEDYGVDASVVLAMIDRESDFDADDIGDGGESFGLCQVQPKWHQERMERLDCDDLLDPFQNVTVAVDYLAEQIDRYDEDVAKALTAYNQGHYNGVITEYAKSVLATAEELRGENNV